MFLIPSSLFRRVPSSGLLKGFGGLLVKDSTALLVSQHEVGPGSPQMVSHLHAQVNRVHVAAAGKSFFGFPLVCGFRVRSRRQRGGTIFLANLLFECLEGVCSVAPLPVVTSVQ